MLPDRAATATDRAPSAPGAPVGDGVRRHAWLPVVLLVAVVAVLAVTAYWPFRWDPPRPVANDVTRTAGGALSFGEHNYARTTGTPAWLADVRAGQPLRVDLRVRPDFPQEYNQVAFFLLASDAWHTDIALGQSGRDMWVWLRRQGSDAGGEPAYVAHQAFTPGRWSTVHLALGTGTLRVVVDGTVEIDDPVPTGFASTWSDGLIVLGDQVQAGRPWQGAISRAEVRTHDHRVDYLAPGALAMPHRFFYLPEHVAPFPPTAGKEWAILLLHLLSFVPIGFLLVYARRLPARPLPAGLVGLGIALVLAAGKFCFHERHMAVADLVVQFAGALLGAYLAARWSRPRVRRPSWSATGQ